MAPLGPIGHRALLRNFVRIPNFVHFRWILRDLGLLCWLAISTLSFLIPFGTLLVRSIMHRLFTSKRSCRVCQLENQLEIGPELELPFQPLDYLHCDQDLAHAQLEGPLEILLNSQSWQHL